MNKIAVYLNRHLVGNVFDKDAILESYSSDRSPLKIKPRLVALPESTSDVRKILRFVNQLSEKKYSLPVSIRGSGLSKSGADLSSGLVLSTEKLTKIRELDAHDRLVHVEAGISLGRLNAVLAPHGLTLPISADPRETIGSLIATSPRDKFSKKYGGIMNYIDRVEAVLPNGDLIQTSRLSRSAFKRKTREKSLEASVYADLDALLNDSADLLPTSDVSRFGFSGLRHVKRLGGKVFDLLPVFFGSEGSLGVITEVILRLDVLPPRPHRLFSTFTTFKSAFEFAEYCSTLAPLSVELYDMRIFKSADAYGKRPDLLSRKLDKGFLVLASFNDKSRKSRKKVKKALSFLPKSAFAVFETIQNSPDFDDFETSLASYLNDDAKGERANFMSDFYVPTNNLSDFLKDLEKLEKSTKRPLELFGSFLTGVFSLRPDFELSKVSERRAALTLLQNLNELLIKHGGDLAGGAPEGRLKSIVIYPSKDKKETKLVSSVKDIFDKNHILSPETKSDYDTRSAVRHLRTSENPGIVS